MEVSEFIQRMWFVSPLLWGACALIWFIRGRGSVGSILGGIGFLILFLNGCLHGLLMGFERYGDIDISELYELVWSLLPYTPILFLIGQILVLSGLATTKWKTSAVGGAMGASQPPRYAQSGYPPPSGPDMPRPFAGDRDTDGDGDDAPDRGNGGDFSDDAAGGYGAPMPGQGAYGAPPAYGQARFTPAAPGAYPQAPYGYARPPHLIAQMGPPARNYRPGWSMVGTMIALGVLTWVFIIVGFILIDDAGRNISDDEAIGLIIAFFLAFCTMVAGMILFYVWLYRSWSAVPPEYRSASPGTAVGYMFIPFFNLYWIFRAIPGLSASTRRAQAALDPRYVGGSSYGIGIAACIVGIIPYLGILAVFLYVPWLILANGDTSRLLRTRSEIEGWEFESWEAE